jgi:hypothetical protein
VRQYQCVCVFLQETAAGDAQPVLDPKDIIGGEDQAEFGAAFIKARYIFMALKAKGALGKGDKFRLWR